jgi:hypothetical protein
MPCDSRALLTDLVFSKTHHLDRRLKEPEGGDLKYEHGDLKRMAQELVDAVNELQAHEETHRCNTAA